MKNDWRYNIISVPIFIIGVLIFGIVYFVCFLICQIFLIPGVALMAWRDYRTFKEVYAEGRKEFFGEQ